MRKFYTLAIALFATSLSFGQEATPAASSSSEGGPAAGNIYLTGSLNFGSEGSKDENKNKGNSSANYGITAQGGYMISDNLGVHLLLGTRSTVQEDRDTDGSKTGTNTFITGLGAKYFMGKNKFYFSPSLNFQMGFSGNKSEVANGDGGFDYENTGKSTSIDIAIIPEFTYFFNSHWSGQFGVGRLGYNSTTNKDEKGNKTGTDSSFDLKANLSAINIGFTYWFR